MGNESYVIVGLIIGVILGVCVRHVTQPNPYDLVQKVYEKYVQDMKHFATAYSELSVQFVNQHLPSAPPASFTRNMPNNNNSEWADADQPEDDEADMMGGNLTL